MEQNGSPGQCDECQERAASIHVTQISNEETVVFHLCEECAAKRGISITLEEGAIESLPFDKAPQSIGPHCARCGMAYGEFKEKGALGCADCYGAFEQELDRLLIEMHGSRIHRGKGSLTLEQLDPAIDIDRLRVDLDRAIRNEEFEQAARLRDRIRNMATDTQGK